MTLRMTLRLTSRLAAAALAGLIAMEPARAQMPAGLPMIRDTEIENLLRDYARPLFRAANVGGSQTNVVIVNSRAFNAFVANGRRIFINAGAILDSRTPNELIGVMAHETGHIAGGHLARLREAVERAQVIAVIGMLVGAAGVAAGAAGGARSGVGEAAPGAITAGAQVGMRSLLSYQRGEEAAADRAAINYLNATGQSAKGMVETFRRLQNESMFVARHVDPYAVSHPMPADRIAIVEPSPRRARTTTASIRPRSMPATSWPARSSPASSTAPTPSCGATRPPTPRCRRAMPAPSRCFASATATAPQPWPTT